MKRGGPAGCARARRVVTPRRQTLGAGVGTGRGTGYITTSPLVDEERVYVRTSGFWTGGAS